MGIDSLMRVHDGFKHQSSHCLFDVKWDDERCIADEALISRREQALFEVRLFLLGEDGISNVEYVLAFRFEVCHCVRSLLSAVLIVVVFSFTCPFGRCKEERSSGSSTPEM